jgi:hypothetical protein
VNPYTAYEYLSFILPGGLITSTAFYGYFGWPYDEPGATYLVGILAVSFVVGHINAGIASWLEPVIWFESPGGRTDPTWGMFTARGPYSDQDRERIEEVVCREFGDPNFRVAYNLAATEMRRRGEAGFLDILNSQIGLYRNLGVASVLATCIVAYFNMAGWHHLPALPWVAVLPAAAVVFFYRYRRFWVRYGDCVVRGARRIGSERDAH